MKKWYIAKSKIQGVGVFLANDVTSNEKIDVGITFFLGFYPIVTPFGSKINHQDRANCSLVYLNGEWHVAAKTDLSKSTEITLDYEKCPWYIAGKHRSYIELPASLSKG